MRVLWLIDSLTLGGAESLVPAFARAVERRRAEVQVAFLKSLGGNPFEAELRGLGVTVTDLGARNLRDLRAFRRLHRLVRDERIDLVHAHLTYAATWGGLLARATGVPCVATLHTGPAEGPPWARDTIRERLLGFVAGRWCAAVIAVSEAARAEHAARGRIAVADMRVIHNGVDVDSHADRERDAVRRTLDVAPGETVVLTVAALRPGKGLDDVLRAMAVVRRPGVRLLVAGEGPLRAGLEAQAAGLGLAERVTWLGLRRDVADLLAASDVFVLASHRDAFPTVLLEAMAAARPVIATRVGGIPEIVADGRTGVLVEPGNPEALAAAMEALLEDAPRAAALGAAGRERVRERFSAARWTERVVALYEEVLSARGAAVPVEAA